VTINDVKSTIIGWLYQQGIKDAVRFDGVNEPFIAPVQRELLRHAIWKAANPMKRKVSQAEVMHRIVEGETIVHPLLSLVHATLIRSRTQRYGRTNA
jgi:hypothetical protein